ncbi:MAG TPA: multidrug effflux MFS transporter [Burkholderiaceae bacterium]|nr:multidrug effflux MFS transporter [Burkholderiaceae bacterium]
MQATERNASDGAGAAGAPALSSKAALWLTAALLSLQPLSTDLYLPTLPAIGAYFSASVAAVQWTLSAFIAAFAVAQLVAGPLSDRYGRYPVIVGGVAIHLTASLLCMAAPTIDVLIVGRIAQAIGACAGVVAVRAVVRDLYEPAAGARLLAAAGTIMGLAPLLGPIVGSQLQAAFGWRAAFAALALFSGALAIVLVRRLKETNRQRDPQALAPRVLAAAWRDVLRSPTFHAYTLANTMSYAGLFAFLAGSSFVLIRVLGLTPTAYGFGFAATVSGYMLGTVICRRLIARLSLAQALPIGAALQAAAGAAMVLLASVQVFHPLAILVPQFFYVIAHGIVQPVAQAGAVARFPRTAGTAAAWMGFIIQMAAAVVGLLIGVTWNGTVYPMVTMIGIAGAGSLAVAVLLVRKHGHVG